MKNSVTLYEEMLGQSFSTVTNKDNAELVFINEKKTFRFYHEQDCCESVFIEEIVGDLDDLIGSPLIEAELVSSVSISDHYNDVSNTWHFYKFATEKGTVVVRWLGESNGYYSEEVDYKVIDNDQ